MSNNARWLVFWVLLVTLVLLAGFYIQDDHDDDQPTSYSRSDAR